MVMIDISVLPAFFIATIVLALSPGPDLLLISAYSSARGFSSGILISMGIFIAGIIQTLLVAFGLGQIMQTMPAIALAVKMIGTLYLAWLGINLLLAWFTRRDLPQQQESIVSLTPKQLISRGLINNLMNPKALLFFSMFLPQFISSAHGATPQILLLGTLLSFIALLVNAIVSVSFSQLGRSLIGGPGITKHMDGVLGAVFLGLAARLATEQ